MASTDLIFDYIEISGFMSFSPKKTQRVILNTNKLTTIIGENLDVGEGERNGVGKSAIIDAILYLFFGRSPRVSNQGFLNYVDPGTMFVTGTASRNGLAFLIERGEQPSVLRLFEKKISDTRDWRTKENGKLIFERTKSTKPETSKRVVELLGFDIKLSDVLLVNNPSDRSCFFLKTEEDQRNIIERIFGFTVFTEKAESLREFRKEENKNLATLESAMIATRQANDRVLKELVQLEEKANAWATERDKTTKFLTQQISSYAKIDFTHELKILNVVDQLLQTLRDLQRDSQSHQRALDGATTHQIAWQSEHTSSISDLQTMISRLQTADAAGDIEVIKKAETLRIAIKETSTELATARRETEIYKRQHESEYAAKTQLIKQAGILESQLMQLSESRCPTCGSEWADTQAHVIHCVTDLDSKNAEIIECDERITQLKEALNQSTSSVERLGRCLDKINHEAAALPPTTFKTVDEAARASAALEQARQQLQAAEIATNPHDQMITELQTVLNAADAQCKILQTEIASQPKTVFENLAVAREAQQTAETLQRQFDQLKITENPYRQTIDNLRSNVLKEIDETEIKTARRRLEHIGLLIRLLSDRESPIRSEMMQEYLPELNERLNRYLEALELPHRVLFDTNMTATFALDEHELSFGNLSTGQRLRVWLASNLALREVFETINYKINLFFIDEVLDKGMSPRGAEVSYQLLEQMATDQKSLFLITHRVELTDRADHTMTLVLEDGLSTIIENAA